jgi:hypothetical protein
MIGIYFIHHIYRLSEAILVDHFIFAFLSKFGLFDQSFPLLFCFFILMELLPLRVAQKTSPTFMKPSHTHWLILTSFIFLLNAKKALLLTTPNALYINAPLRTNI